MLEKLKKIDFLWAILMLYVFLLPFHAVFVTYSKCRLWIDTNILRFWKEIFVVFLMIWVAFNVFK